MQFSTDHQIIWCTADSKGLRQRYVTVFVDIINSTTHSLINDEKFNTIFINHFTDILRYQMYTCFTCYTEPVTILHVSKHWLEMWFYSIATKCITKHTTAVLKYLFWQLPSRHVYNIKQSNILSNTTVSLMKHSYMFRSFTRTSIRISHKNLKKRKLVHKDLDSFCDVSQPQLFIFLLPSFGSDCLFFCNIINYYNF